MAHILNANRKAIASRLGPEALEASDAMLDMALDYQREGGASLFGFVQWFGSTETTLKREMDKAGSEVRMMTVHGAKGLEAPIVIIADAAQNPFGNKSKPLVLDFAPKEGVTLPIWFATGVEPLLPELAALKDQAKERNLQESNRLLYVAMTRAEDELYIAGLGQGAKGVAAKDSWWPKLIEKLGEPKRFGAADIFLPPARAPEKALPLNPPNWLALIPPPEAKLKRVGLNAALSGGRTYDALAAKMGRARHRLLQDLGNLPEAERTAFAAKCASRLGLRAVEALKLAEALSKPELAPFLGQGSRAEVEITGKLANGTSVSGRLDRLAERQEGLWLLDYKTGTAASPDHLRQMAGYVELLRQAFPGKPITAALFFTQNARLQFLTADQLTAALQESDTALT